MLREVRPRPDLPIHGPSLKSGKTLNDLGRTGAIIRKRDHICAPPSPWLAWRVPVSTGG